MSKIEFISHDAFPDDDYTKEIVYLCLEGKYRVAYVRKAAKFGGMFWSVANVRTTRNGVKEYFPAFIQDSNFLEKEIREFLEKRPWENGPYKFAAQPKSMDEVADNERIPF